MKVVLLFGVSKLNVCIINFFYGGGGDALLNNTNMAVIYKVRNPELDYVEGQGILIDSFTSHKNSRKYLDTFRLVVLNVIETIVKGSFQNMYGFIPSIIYICSDVNGNIYTIRINRFNRNSVIQQIATTDELQNKYKSKCPEMFEIPSLSRGDIKYGG